MNDKAAGLPHLLAVQRMPEVVISSSAAPCRAELNAMYGLEVEMSFSDKYYHNLYPIVPRRLGDASSLVNLVNYVKKDG